MNKLKYLYFDSCVSLNKYPDGIENMETLHTLSFKKMNLKDGDIPDFVWKCTRIKDLSFRDNNLTELPKEIGNLVNLEVLFLNNNNLTSLPEEIGNCTKINTLWVDGNRLKTLPRSICNIEMIDSFYSRYNPWEWLPECVDDGTFRLRSGNVPGVERR
ncbi:leucine-rich repeat domain-containing protein [Flammeovirga sp. MY04]|nr:leucine-rich repeat domain-containing protein [Flammeovirga sp. MY04]ANQ52253.2 leucine-rich repeat domain-containing protein [Flammeovirga sp. MY04]